LDDKINKMAANGRVEKAKTHKGARILKAREPLTTENVKKSMFLKARNVNQMTTDALKDIYTLKKPEAVFMQKKNEMLPFEDATNLEKLLATKDTSLFAMGSNNKKRPNNLVMGRTFDRDILDLFEFGVENLKTMMEFKTQKVSAMIKPILVFNGAKWNDSPKFRRLKNFFIDFFRGEPRDHVALQGLEHTLSFTATDTNTILLRSYRVVMKKSGRRTPRVELEEIGPRMDLKERRHKIAADDTFKQALRQPKALKKTTKKNQEKDELGTSFGRLHMERQNIGVLQTRKMKGLKSDKRKSSVADTSEGSEEKDISDQEMDVN